MYKVIVKFADAKDFNYIYEIGDEYPRKGYKPTQDRIEELASNKNRLKTPLIEADKKIAKETEPIKEETVVKKRKKKAE